MPSERVANSEPKTNSPDRGETVRGPDNSSMRTLAAACVEVYVPLATGGPGNTPWVT